MDNTTVSTAGRSYDTFGRIASVSNGIDTLSYTYRPGGQLSLSGWRNAQNDAMSNQSYEYDQYNRLISIKLNNVNEVSYTLNAKDQRTAATYANAGLWNFTYDDKGQVTGANGSSKSYTYSYDGIGNRLTANENSTITNYTSNLLNQYTLINSAVPTYDADGNMTGSGNGWGYTYNGENRITQATKGSTSVTMAYDYAGRRISKTVTVSGVVQNSYKYVYDGFKLIAVYNNNDLVMTFTWQPESLGMDVPVSMTYGGATYYYVTDGNKNVTALLDASGNRVAEYVYGPFGQTVSATGSMAQINPFRFSSEFHDDETGLVYYNYRYYSPDLGRWTKRDPIEEEGCLNLYALSNNNSINFIDKNGKISLASKIMTRLSGRIAKVSLLGLNGIMHNWSSYSDPIFFEDEEKEVASFSQIYALLEIRTNAISQALHPVKFIAISIDKFNAAKKYKNKGVLNISGDFPSTGWWLNDTSVYMMSIEYKARCRAGWIHYKDVKINYEWHDNIDGNSFIESYKAGNLFYSGKSFISNTVEGVWDIVMDKIAGVDYKIIIKGNTSISDGKFPRPKQ